MRDQLNHWRKLQYHDPAAILRRLRGVEAEIADLDLDQTVRRLRTGSLKKHREWRDAAIFCYGIGLVQGWKVSYATEEASDYDFVAHWKTDDTHHFCPVQLKELPPADLNPRVTLEDILRGSSKSSNKSSTVLAVKLNRREQFDPTAVSLPNLGWQQVWFFWSATPDARRWVIFGDVASSPGRFEFDYPT